MATVTTPSGWLTAGTEDGFFLSLCAAALLLLVLQSHSGPSKEKRALLQELSTVPQEKLKRGIVPSQQSKTRNICDILKSPANDPTAVVFWGSQGGTAEAIASRYASELSSRFSLRATAADLADYDHVHLPNIPSHALVVFVLATYGEGDPTDNAHALIADLRAMLARRCSLRSVRYAMFGLGNKNYRLYNKVALDTDRLLLDMGAVRLGTLGLGDDSRGTTEEDFISWKTDMAQVLAKEFNLQQTTISYMPRIEIRPVPGLTDVAAGVYQGEPSPSTQESKGLSSPRISSELLVLPIERACELITNPKNDDRHCLHVEFNIGHSQSAHYETGDYLQIWPMNPEDEVTSLLTVLGMWGMRKTVVRIVPSDNAPQSRSNLPSPTTLEALFRHCLEICGPVSRDVMTGLTQFVSDAEVKRRFQAVVDDPDTFRTQVTSRRLTLATALREILGDQSGSIQFSLSYILESLKRLLPRSYSISSSALIDPHKLAITALAVTETSQGNLAPASFKGVTSHYLLQLTEEFSSEESVDSQEQRQSRYSTAGPRGVLKGGKIFAQIRRSEFKLPSNAATPILMVGSGTGVAPFRAFVQERMKMKSMGAEIGKTVLVVGHRSPGEDFYYKELWQEARECLGKQFELHSAFSRSSQRMYVQDVLKTKAELVLDVLGSEGAGALYVCGSSAMARGVKNSLKEIWSQSRAISSHGETDADAWISELQRLRRLQEDSWG